MIVEPGRDQRDSVRSVPSSGGGRTSLVVLDGRRIYMPSWPHEENPDDDPPQPNWLNRRPVPPPLSPDLIGDCIAHLSYDCRFTPGL